MYSIIQFFSERVFIEKNRFLNIAANPFELIDKLIFNNPNNIRLKGVMYNYLFDII